MTPDATEAVFARWERLLTPFGGADSAIRRAFDDLAARYAGLVRYYHTLDHVRAVLEVLEAAGGKAPPLLVAAWYHDAVYDSQAGDNEERSADLARAALAALNAPAAVRDETARLILLTKTHETDADDADGRLLLDADLAVLGADEAGYDRYARAIRREYAWVDEAAYRAGRRKVLQGFLDRPRIYHTPALFDRLEAAARRNLRREIAVLA
jgi:predicted metal-dependent HD superfamily phosphohydrolase